VISQSTQSVKYEHINLLLCVLWGWEILVVSSLLKSIYFCHIAY